MISSAILDAQGTRIRANQGHSISVDLKLPHKPPALLYHGTAIRFLELIDTRHLQMQMPTER